MMDAAEIARWPRDKTLPELLRGWAKVLDLPSGRFVNEDLEAAADALEQARNEYRIAHEQFAEDVISFNAQRDQAQKERDEAWTAVRVRDEQINVMVKKLTAQRDQAQQSAKDARALAFEECAKWLDEQAEGHYDKYNRNPSSSGSPLINYAADEISRCATYLRARIEAMLEQKP